MTLNFETRWFLTAPKFDQAVKYASEITINIKPYLMVKDGQTRYGIPLNRSWSLWHMQLQITFNYEKRSIPQFTLHWIMSPKTIELRYIRSCDGSFCSELFVNHLWKTKFEKKEKNISFRTKRDKLNIKSKTKWRSMP